MIRVQSCGRILNFQMAKPKGSFISEATVFEGREGIKGL